ncbi:MAG: colicin V production CvpA [Chromatiales bacterium 21-64-14]|nr:MAG: colicin V production CvpA [Chromatiales bacterium 21-64-14]HQU15525.1 CvpA family protein [Gammaproteobacteria bacterium]
MTWADYAIIAVIAVSVALSVVRGFMREALALAAWIAAFWVALVFSDKLAGLFARFISTPSVRVAVAFAVLFVLTLLVGALLNYAAVQVVKKSGLTGTDRLVGALFGLARGVALVALLVLLAGLTPAPKDPWWRESLLLGHFQSLAVWLRGWLPPGIAANFVFK